MSQESITSCCPLKHDVFPVLNRIIQQVKTYFTHLQMRGTLGGFTPGSDAHSTNSFQLVPSKVRWKLAGLSITGYKVRLKRKREYRHQKLYKRLRWLLLWWDSFCFRQKVKPTTCYACTAQSRYQLPGLVTTRMVCVPTRTIWWGDSSLGPTTTLSHQFSDWCVAVSKETEFQWDVATQLTLALPRSQSRGFFSACLSCPPSFSMLISNTSPSLPAQLALALTAASVNPPWPDQQ